MAPRRVRKVSSEEIQRVQNFIEECLQLYMNREEVVKTLLKQAKIEPILTVEVLQKLEEENQEFFREYHVRLILMHQIMLFNKLLQHHVELTRRRKYEDEVAYLRNPSGPRASQCHQNPAWCAPGPIVPPLRPGSMQNPIIPTIPAWGAPRAIFPPSRPGSMQNPIITDIPNSFISVESQNTSMQTSDGTYVQNRNVEVAPAMLSTQNLHMGRIQSMQEMMRLQPGYSKNFAFEFFMNGNVLETHPTIRDASSFDSNSQTLKEPCLDTDISSIDLRQIPENFGRQDLTQNFSDMQEIYPWSTYLSSNKNIFWNH